MKPSLPKGTRDFGPSEVNKRNYIFNTLREVFVKFGFLPIETPTMENLSTLTGKYGEEGDQLLFKVLNNGDFLSKVSSSLQPFKLESSKEDFKNIFKESKLHLYSEILNDSKNFTKTYSTKENKENINLNRIRITNRSREILNNFFEQRKDYSNNEIEALKQYLIERSGDEIKEIKDELKSINIGEGINLKKLEKTKIFQPKSIEGRFEYFLRAELPRIKDRLIKAKNLVPEISKRGLRYDLTVPFARYVVMHQNDIAFPFKRYQIQPVWRADRPQKGRYQEFYQCDVDVVGSDSLTNEAELTQIYDEAFAKFGIKVVIKINNRKILSGIAEVAGISDKLVDMTVAIDKLDKIGIEKVKEEMAKRDIPDTAIEKIVQILQISDLQQLETQLQGSETGLKGIEELETVFRYFPPSDAKNKVVFDITLARGLSYYTGCIFEVAVDTDIPEQKDVVMGSIGGGGRYDDLTGIFGMKDMSGVGVSFGAARIFDVMEELNLFPEEDQNNLKLLFIAFDEGTHFYSFKCLNQVRAAGINAELYPDPVKLKKQMKYANSREVPFVILVGSEEMSSGLLTLKNMREGTQEKVTITQIIERFS